MINQTLHIGAAQQLQLTPRLQKAIHMLQLSSQELNQEIQTILESNILLEEGEAFEENDTLETCVSETNEAEGEEDVSVDWDSATEESPDKASSDIDPMAVIISRASGANTSIQAYLLDQLHLSSITEEDREVCEVIIDSINDHGFLEADVEELQQSLHKMDKVVTQNKIEILIAYVQTLGPIGVGARDLQESLSLQLNALPATTPGLKLATALVQEHFSLLADHHYAKLCRIYNVDMSVLTEAVKLVQSLTPRPGRAIMNTDLEQIIPDVMVKHTSHGWSVVLNKRTIPKLHFNQHYLSILDNAKDANESQFIHHHLQEARWLIKCLQSRNETLLKVASCIVQHQQAFFKHGPGAMKPLVLKDVADAIGMHQSTVSRITTRKYIQTPQGTFELKYFFTSQLQTSYGEQCSGRAIQTYMKEMIKNEDSNKPLSDEMVAKKLSAQGIQVARRTVAKYRELMGIEPANRRKNLIS